MAMPIWCGAVMLELRGVSKEFRDGVLGHRRKKVLDDVSLTIRRGDILGLIGESGSGKTTLAKIALRLMEASSGSVYLDGRDVSRLSQREFRALRRKVQIIFQHPEGALDPQYRLRESICEALLKSGTPRSRLQDGTREACELVNLPTELLDRYPHQVSGGEVQRVALARVLAFEPDYLFLDEPTSMLDLSVQAHIINLIKGISTRNNTGLVMISHDIDLIRSVCTTAAVLHNGRLIAEGSMELVLSESKNEQVKRMVMSWNQQKRHFQRQRALAEDMLRAPVMLPMTRKNEGPDHIPMLTGEGR